MIKSGASVFGFFALLEDGAESGADSFGGASSVAAPFVSSLLVVFSFLINSL